MESFPSFTLMPSKHITETSDKIFRFAVASTHSAGEKAEKMIDFLATQKSLTVIPKEALDYTITFFNDLHKEINFSTAHAFNNIHINLQRYRNLNTYMNLGGLGLLCGGLVGRAYTPEANKKTRWAYTALGVAGAACIVLASVHTHFATRKIIATLIQPKLIGLL
ncbi:MAG: hypothetical protein LVR00_01740 [Rhabdochlamydiaceae bacterium]|jgi:hypothetical protein